MPVVLFVIVIYVIAIFVYAKLEKEVLEELDFSDWNVVPDINDTVNVKSRQTLNNYDLIKYFKEESIRFERAKMQINRNEEVLDKLRNFLDNNSYTNHILYFKIKKHINALIDKASYYKICVNYYSSAGNHLGQKFLLANMQTIKMFEQDPSLLMGKGEYNKYLKEQQKNEIEKRQHEFYDKVNNVIDIANQNREKIIKKENYKL